MNPIKRLSNLWKQEPKAGANYIGAPSFAQVNPYGFFDCYTSDAYSSAYPSIRAISNEYMAIRPFAIDANGKPVKHPAVDALYHPNQKDSSVSFFEKMAVSTLALPNTYVLVWRKENGEAKPGGDFYGKGGQNIAGYTFLEGYAIEIREKKTYFRVGSQEFSEDEVIALPGGVNPYRLYDGYSPLMAAKRWATLDDYIADYQKGFFENNAIPAGQFIITAANQQDYEDTVANMQSKHRGAGKNNNVTYVPRPMGKDGKPADAKIEWIPFAQSNKDIDFKNLFDQTNTRLDLAFGVPQIVKGVDDAATYANAQVAEKTFAKRAVYPLALRNYTQFTHELNRITGGMGIAITFDYEIPTVADEEKVNAETKNIEANLIRTLTLEGYSLDSVVDAFELSNGYKLLKKDTAPAVIENDKPDVDEGNEVDESPDPTKIDGVTPLNEAAKHRPKAELTDEDKLERIALTLMNAQIDKAVAAVDEPQDVADQEDLDKFIDDALKLITSIVVVAGIEQLSEGIALLAAAGLSTEQISDFVLKDNQIDDYRSYLTKVARSYSDLTTEAIRAVLERAEIDGLSANQIKTELRKIPELKRYEATRLARTETVRANSRGSLYSMEQIQDETGVELNKVWQTNSAEPCPYCQAMNGTTVAVTQPFVALGGSIVAEDGSILVNDFIDMDTAQSHPNCRCSQYYEVVR